MRTLFATLLLCLCPLLVLSADKPKDLIVGKWDCVSPEKDKGLVMEFKDGSITSTKGGKTVYTGKYRFKDEDAAIFTNSDGKSAVLYRIKISKEDLTIIDDKTSKERSFKRIP